MASVPLPWWASKSQTATRRAPRLLPGHDGGEGDLIEVTESHGLRDGGVVAGWAQEGKDRAGLGAGQGVLRRLDRAGHGATGVIENAGEIRRVGIEVAREPEAVEQ
jgi:hypothetical protein